jgi:hypothetical protein
MPEPCKDMKEFGRTIRSCCKRYIRNSRLVHVSIYIIPRPLCGKAVSTPPYYPRITPNRVLSLIEERV